MRDIAIRPLEESDRETYLQMCREFYRSDAVLHPVPEENFDRCFREMVSGSPYAKGLMLEKDGRAAGYGLISVTFSQEAGGLVWWLEELYLRPEFRGQGLGSRYLRGLMARRPKEVARFRLEAEPENQDALRLYRRLGFTPLGYDQMILDFV